MWHRPLHVTSTEMVSLHDLCIEEGKSAWQLQIDVVCLDCDGNATDAALLAVTAALHTVRLPNTVISEEGLVSITAGLLSHSFVHSSSDLAHCTDLGGNERWSEA